MRSIKNMVLSQERIVENTGILEEAILILLNKRLEEGHSSDTWKNAELGILYKKGDYTNIDNYRPISLRANLYKLLCKVLTRRLSQKLEFCQPIERRKPSSKEELDKETQYPQKCTPCIRRIFQTFRLGWKRYLHRREVCEPATLCRRHCSD